MATFSKREESLTHVPVHDGRASGCLRGQVDGDAEHRSRRELQGTTF